MNIVLQVGAIQSILREEKAPDIIHGHDGHTELLGLLMKECRAQGFFGKTGVLVTIHNAGTAYRQIIGTANIASELTGIQESKKDSIWTSYLAEGYSAGLYTPRRHENRLDIEHE